METIEQTHENSVVEKNIEISRRQEAAIKNFLSLVLHRDGEKPIKKYEFGLVDVSNPYEQDLTSISKNNYQINNLKLAQRPDGKNDYHFYVGQTEFHIKGQAADDLTELIQVNE